MAKIRGIPRANFFAGNDADFLCLISPELFAGAGALGEIPNLPAGEAAFSAHHHRKPAGHAVINAKNIAAALRVAPAELLALFFPRRFLPIAIMSFARSAAENRIFDITTAGVDFHQIVGEDKRGIHAAAAVRDED